MTQQQEEIGRLQSTFEDAAFSSHGPKWDSLWRESYTPWDRGGPSLALADLVQDKPELFSDRKGRTALVPGCGRGYDVLLLSALGYDVVGLDYSADAVREASANEENVINEELYDSVGKGEKGTVTWVQGDFFDDAWVRTVGRGRFDVIFDYTVRPPFHFYRVYTDTSQFFCALPPEARPKWAARMSSLLTPNTGRLICLEWPLHKDSSTGGPPWGLRTETYVAHLSRPGEDIRYGADGKPLPEEVQQPATDTGLRCLTRLQPRRTHKAGLDSDGKVIDYISVWSR